MIGMRKALKEDIAGRDLDELLAILPPETQWLVTERFLTTQWYDATSTDEFTRLVGEWLGYDAEEFALRLGRSVVRGNTGLIVNSMLSVFASPQRIAKYLPPYWHKLYDSGAVVGDYDAPSGLLSIRITDWKSHSALACLNPLGSIAEFARRIKTPELRSYERTRCVADGDAMCEYELRFGT